MEEFTKLFDSFQKEFDTSPDEYYYVISKKQLEQWKKNPQEKLPPINEDIAVKSDAYLHYAPLYTHMWKNILKDGVVSSDYEILSEELWAMIKMNNTVAFEIKRDSSIINGKKHVNVELIELNVSILIRSNFEKRNFHQLGKKFYVAPKWTVQQFSTLLEETFKTLSKYYFHNNGFLRLYLLPASWTESQLEKTCLQQLNPTFKLIELPEAVYLKPELTIEECNILPQQMLIVDGKEDRKTYVISNPMFGEETKCEGCFEYFPKLEFSCICKKVFYCTEHCLKQDERYHLEKCEKQNSDEEINKYQLNENSVRGLCGLRNLGNTCFMNSALQCLLNTPVLRDHFLNDQYINEINENNVLGSKGDLCRRFASLMKKVWYGDQSAISPYSLKKTISKVQTQFSGYQQHDSQEFLAFMLDILHEDLNKIKQKPYIEIDDKQELQDFELAKQSWEIHKKRNDSLIVDNFYGLYKSELKCPQCSKISVKFDPYLMVTVQLPKNSIKVIQYNLVDDKLIFKVQKCEFQYDKQNQPTLNYLLEQNNLDPLNQILFISSSSYVSIIEEFSPKDLINVVKKKSSYSPLQIRTISPEEVAIPDDERIKVVLFFGAIIQAYYKYKKYISSPRQFFFRKSDTPRIIHERIYKLILPTLQSFDGLKLEDDFQYYVDNILHKIYHLEWKSNSRYQMPCAFCSQERCFECCVDLDQKETLEDFKGKDSTIQFEIILIWDRGVAIDGKIEDVAIDWSIRQEIDTTQNLEDIQNTNNLTLQECLRFSTKPEILTDDNLWYCNTCKDHMYSKIHEQFISQASKSIKIYKTSKILVFHLKRFKHNHKFKSKLETLVKYDIEALDMSEFVMNTNPPDAIEQEDQVMSNYFVNVNFFYYRNHIDL